MARRTAAQKSAKSPSASSSTPTSKQPQHQPQRRSIGSSWDVFASLVLGSWCLWTVCRFLSDGNGSVPSSSSTTGVLVKNESTTISTPVPIQQQQPRGRAPLMGNITTSKATPCTQAQLVTIHQQLHFEKCNLRKPWWTCGIVHHTKCPHNTWLQEYYHQRHFPTTSYFVGIRIGCNKGYSAIDTARMGMNAPHFDKLTWGQALDTVGNVDPKQANGECGERQAPASAIVDAAKPRPGEMHCVEPASSTFGSLQTAAKKLGLSNNGNTTTKFILQQAAISSSNGKIGFPLVPAGTESPSLEWCLVNPNQPCEQIPMYTLETYVEKFVTTAAEKPPIINVLSIDVEGYDMDVLLGAANILERVQYLEFEYHYRGNWNHKYHIWNATQFLDRQGFTCYWAGGTSHITQKGRLWRITACDFPDVYTKWRGWSSVACVHRSQTILAKDMEDLFLKTLQL